MEQYLTIGEISKIKKISVKSLRYYEQIGILIPAKINADNGYRYYSNNQMLVIDMIKFLGEMDIPLKEWHKYINAETGFHLVELIEDSKSHVMEQILELKSKLQKLELAARGLQDNEKYEHYQGYYSRKIPARNILCHPMNDPTSQIEFHKSLSILFEEASAHHASANYPSGTLMDYSYGEQHFFAFIEIYEHLEGHPFYRHFPEHEYCCIRKEQKSITRIAQDEPKYFTKHENTTIIESDCLTSPIEFRLYPTELQFFYPME